MIYDVIACEYFESWACQYRKPVGTTVWSRHHHFHFSKIHITRYKKRFFAWKENFKRKTTVRRPWPAIYSIEYTVINFNRSIFYQFVGRWTWVWRSEDLSRDTEYSVFIVFTVLIFRITVIRYKSTVTNSVFFRFCEAVRLNRELLSRKNSAEVKFSWDILLGQECLRFVCGTVT